MMILSLTNVVSGRDNTVKGTQVFRAVLLTSSSNPYLVSGASFPQATEVITQNRVSKSRDIVTSVELDGGNSTCHCVHGLLRCNELCIWPFLPELCC